VKLILSLFALALALVFSVSAFADDLTTPSDPERSGFSSSRLARIASWYQARVDALMASDPASGPDRLGNQLTRQLSQPEHGTVRPRPVLHGQERKRQYVLERRHFLGATLGSVLIPGLAAAQTQAAKPGGSGQLGFGNVPLPATSGAERLNELAPENAAMSAYAGLWDVTETVWDKPRRRSGHDNRARRRAAHDRVLPAGIHPPGVRHF
jgi:hypothetical protein